MATRKGSNNLTSGSKQWDKVFHTLVEMINIHQRKIASLEDQIKLEHELFHDYLSQMKSDLRVREMLWNVKALYLNLVVGQKERESFSYKIKLDDTVSDLADFRAWFDHLSSKSSETNENGSKIKALLSERNFVWNQYKKMENDLTERLKSKSTEVEQANEKLQKLFTSMETLQSSTSEKDRTILKLKTNVAELEEASVKKNEEISRLSSELESLRKGRSDSVTPVLHGCSAKFHLNVDSDSRNLGPQKESHPSQILEKKECRSSKRKAVDPIPSLFTSAFKVPKLKNSSPRVI